MTARAVGRRGKVQRRGLVADEAAGLDQAVGEPARDEGVPVVDGRGADLAVEDAVTTVDEAAGVAERSGIPDRCGGRRWGPDR